MKAFFALVLFSIVSSTSISEAKVKRVSEFDGNAYSLQYLLKTGDVIQFVKGDVITLKVETNGDLLETTQSSPSLVTVKQEFFLREDQGNILLSFDGINFKPIQDVLKGNISAGASGSTGVATGINFLMSMYLK
ncbi:MAG: hypothetical protein IT289_05550 [Oligoflexia bacterium]|nr:hypothetical protein [Oligoflexia bacterium]